MTEPRIEILGIRHHGPGSARSVAAALRELMPDLVLIEGAPELDALIPLADDPDLVPPVAALVYAVDAPRKATFYPFAAFSPEWIALRWALTHRVEVRFADLPAMHWLAAEYRKVKQVGPKQQPDDDPDDSAAENEVAGREPAEHAAPDVIGELARTAGYDDPERWWEDAVEHRHDTSLADFAHLRDAIALVRPATADQDDEFNRRREAAMRKAIRAATREGRQRIAFVCGAFHAPALDPASFPTAAADNRLLTGLPRTKVAATWVPWTSNRLARRSGYGAGVNAPGWYQHLFSTWASDPDLVGSTWMVRVARALREQQLVAPPASVVEATRLADALAAVRGRPSVGLAELSDATQSVLCDGSELPLRLVDEALVIGHDLGQVPERTPMVPLAADLARTQRSLRLKPTADVTQLVLDLRKEAQLARSVLFHRLGLLDIPWAREVEAGRTTGTFKEAWELAWEPEFAVALIEASGYGTTVVGAAEQLVREQAEQAPLARLAELLESCLLAELPAALRDVVGAVAERSAHQHDVPTLLLALGPLARTLRYGDVRDISLTGLAHVVETIVVRASIGLRTACASLDDDAAAHVRAAVETADQAIALLDDHKLRGPWREALGKVGADSLVHGSVAGRVNRMLLEAAAVSGAEAGRRLSRQLSQATPAAQAAAWLDGFLAGDAMLLLHEDELLGLIDDWVSSISEETFEDLLPLLRRTFARFESGERRHLGRAIRNLDATISSPEASHGVDLQRAWPAMMRVAELLGLQAPPSSPGYSRFRGQ